MQWSLQPSRFILAGILFFAFLTRIWQLHLPTIYVFDEVYHAVTAKLILHNDPRAFEWWNPAPEPKTAVDWLHPPLAKYTQALSMYIFGENTFGWRASSAVFGTLVILMTYLLSKNLFRTEKLSLLAAALASLDGLLLVQSRIAMNDIHVTFFILLALTLYTKYRTTVDQRRLWLVGTSIALGLAVGSKWSGMFAVGIVGVFESWLLLQQFISRVRKETLGRAVAYATQFSFQRLALLIAIPGLLYLTSYSQMFIQGKSLFCRENEVVKNTCYLEIKKDDRGNVTETYISHFHELHNQIWWYQTNLTATHGYQSRPWQWWLNLRPVWYHVDYVNATEIANIYAMSNPLLIWAGDLAVIGSVILLLSKLVRNFRSIFKSFWLGKLTTFSPLLSLLVSYFSVWLFWILSPRIMFFYHYTPAMPFLAIILAYWLFAIWQGQEVVTDTGARIKRPTKQKSKTNYWHQVGVGVCVGPIAIAFIAWYPLWTGIPVSKTFANKLYFALPSWK